MTSTAGTGLTKDGSTKGSQPATPVLPPTSKDQAVPGTESREVDAVGIAEGWLKEAQKCITAQDVKGFVELFHEEGWWRDVLVLDFDFNSLRKSEIAPYLSSLSLPLPGIVNLSLDRVSETKLVPVGPGLEWVQGFVKFETKDCRGTGMIRLKQADGHGKGPWKAYTFFTQAWEIKGHEEFAYHRRPLGAEHGENIGKKNWLDRRKEKLEFANRDPTVLIIGGGQNGLMIAARLGALGIDTLVVDKSKRIGDCWRNRYHTLALHDPVWADAFPYVPYPPHWPIYMPKDKIANWFENYAETMELNIWMSSSVTPGATYDPAKGHWTVEVVRGEGGTKRMMKPRHLILATGLSGEPRLPTFPRDEFTGEVCHSSKHKGGEAWKGKKAVVVGCCNSGHDIAADFYEQGADVTIVQRSSTYVMSSEHGIPGLLNGYYEEDGPPTADGDLMLTSLPIDLINEFHVEATKEIAKKDNYILTRLQDAGFKINPYVASRKACTFGTRTASLARSYPGELFIKYFREAGGYYIDVGCSALIADRKVKLKQGKEIVKLTPKGVLFEDDVELPADIVVCATGYGSMRDTVRNVIGPHVADQLGPLWGQDKQGEIPGAWRLCGQPHFWLQCGNLFQARCFSKHVAMQIHMIETGVWKDGNFAGRLGKADPDPRF